MGTATKRKERKGASSKSLFHDILNMSLRKLRKRELEPIGVAVVDSGIDSTHPDLAERVVASHVILPSEDGSPCMVQSVPLPTDNDACGHGTGVAGIVADIAPNARLHDIRVLNESNLGTGRQLVAGFRQAIETGARIVNLSLASRKAFSGELNEICEAAYRNNQIVIASMRNHPREDNGYPAELSNCIAVGMDAFPSRLVWKYRRDHPIEWLADGDMVRGPAKGGGYTEYLGSSFATPTISGIVALWIGSHPDLRPYEIKTLLKLLARG